MFGIFLLKTLCQLSLYFFFVQLVNIGFPLYIPPFVFMMVVTTALSISYFLRNYNVIVRFMPLIIIVFMVPFSGTVDLAVQTIPMILYTTFIAGKRRYLLNEDQVRSVQSPWLGLLGLCVVISTLTVGVGLAFIVIAIVSAIFLSRNIRHDAETVKDPLYMLLNIMLVIIVLAVVTPVLGGVYGVRHWILDTIGGGWAGFVARLQLAIDNTNWSWMQFEIPQMGGPEAADGPQWYDMGADRYGYDDIVESIGMFFIIPAVIAFICLVVVVIVIIKQIYSGEKDNDATSVVFQRRRIVESVAEIVNTDEKVTPNQKSVRHVYRRLLKLLQKRRARLFSNMTSHDVSEVSESVTGDMANDLRAVYIQARYSAHEVTEQDIATAKDALARVRAQEVVR